MKFAKYEAAGNDFIIFKGEEIEGINYNSLARSVCSRRFGIGADGILIVANSDRAHIKMLYFNSDGSQGEMCGNGIRSFSKFVYENQILKNENFQVETLDGIKNISLNFLYGEVEKISVDMGKAYFKAEDIPVKLEKEYILEENIYIDGLVYQFSAIRVGVPHVVIFIENIKDIDIELLGGKIEGHELFPDGVNVNFVEVKNRKNIRIYTWERGAGRTLGCGTGSCSAVMIGNKLDLLDHRVLVETEGGHIEVEVLEEAIVMTGGANLVARGQYNFIEKGERSYEI